MYLFRPRIFSRLPFTRPITSSLVQLLSTCSTCPINFSIFSYLIWIGIEILTRWLGRVRHWSPSSRSALHPPLCYLCPLHEGKNVKRGLWGRVGGCGRAWGSRRGSSWGGLRICLWWTWYRGWAGWCRFVPLWFFLPWLPIPRDSSRNELGSIHCPFLLVFVLPS